MNRYLSHFAVITILPAYLPVIRASWGDQAPERPYPAGIMTFIALFSRWWRRVMNPRLRQLSQQSVINLQES